MVVDSYNIWNVLENIIGTELREFVEVRDGFLGVRPDSGDPTEIVSKVLNILGDKFGYSTNLKGYKVLPKYLKVIQGDGISYESLGPILESVVKEGWSAENLVFGSGGALLQRLDRDTLKCAFKCSMAVVDGEEREVFKDPLTDPGKRSKKGRLFLLKKGEVWSTVNKLENSSDDMLVTVYENGDMVHEWGWEDVKARTCENE